MSPPPPPSNPHPTFKLFNHSVTISQIQAVIPPHLPEHDMRTSLLYLVRDQIQVLVVRFGIYYVDLLLSPLCSSRVWWAARVFLNWWLQGLALTGLWVFGDKTFSPSSTLTVIFGFMIHMALWTPYFNWSISHHRHRANHASMERDEV